MNNANIPNFHYVKDFDPGSKEASEAVAKFYIKKDPRYA